MLDFSGWIVATVVDVFLFSGPNADRRTYEAYVEAYRSVEGQPTPDNLLTQREQFKQHSAPGAYAEPDGAPLASWIASWSAGDAPRQARGKARRYRPNTT